MSICFLIFVLFEVVFINFDNYRDFLFFNSTTVLPVYERGKRKDFNFIPRFSVVSEYSKNQKTSPICSLKIWDNFLNPNGPGLTVKIITASSTEQMDRSLFRLRLIIMNHVK